MSGQSGKTVMSIRNLSAKMQKIQMVGGIVTRHRTASSHTSHGTGHISAWRRYEYGLI